MFKNHNRFKSLIRLIVIVTLVTLGPSCDGGDNDDGSTTEVIPTGLSLTLTPKGQDMDNPDGDGSGVLEVEATANDAVRYVFEFAPGETQESTSGSLEYTYTLEGTNVYQVKVTAYSSTEHTATTSENINLYVAPREFSNLVFSDEFDTDGALDDSKWIHETQGPNAGRWWNGEEQHYTDRLDNSFVSDGTLKIVAKKERYTDSGITLQYTSARLNSKFSFTYGRVDVRAKLPAGEGTWPAIWMLGSNINTVGWPACGEIDIMEHWGHDPTQVASAIHTPFCSGANNCDAAVGKTQINDFDTEFHVYSTIWKENEIQFLIDGEFRYAYNPDIKNSENWPFTADQFILLNVAMGGSWFSIDPDFVESAMEIDYVRVYQ